LTSIDDSIDGDNNDDNDRDNDYDFCVIVVVNDNEAADDNDHVQLLVIDYRLSLVFRMSFNCILTTDY